MKRWLIFACVIALSVGGVVYAVRRKSQARVGPEALLDLIAGVQRESTRVPARLTRISDQDEIAAGDEFAVHEMSEKLEPADREMERYIQEVGHNLAIRAHRLLPYRFHYLPAPGFVNAFALPGGHVFIGRGLIQLMDSEDELAAVLGHEIEHIDQRHCVERLQVEATLRKLHLGLAGELAKIPIAVFQAGYTKEQELEADREGTRLEVASGYSPMGAVRLFEAFQRTMRTGPQHPRTPQEEAARIALHTLGEYFRSHPWPDERIAQVQRMIASEHWQDRLKERPLRIRVAAPKPAPAATAPVVPRPKK